MQSSAICNGEQGRGRGVEDGCDFTLIVHMSMRVRVHPHGVGGVSGISKSYADFTGTAGIVCVCLCVCTCHLRQHIKPLHATPIFSNPLLEPYSNPTGN